MVSEARLPNIELTSIKSDLLIDKDSTATNSGVLIGPKINEVVELKTDELSLSSADKLFAIGALGRIGEAYLFDTAIQWVLRTGNPVDILMLISASLATSICRKGGLIKMVSAKWSLIHLVGRLSVWILESSNALSKQSINSLIKANELVNLFIVAKNSAPKLQLCAKNVKTRPARAFAYGAVHLLNLGYQISRVGAVFKNFLFGLGANISFDWDPSAKDIDYVSRLSDPGFNGKSFYAAKNIFGIGDVDRYTCDSENQSEFCTNLCQSVKKTWREIAKQVHPDKNSNPLATLAVQNLNSAKDTLYKVLGC